MEEQLFSSIKVLRAGNEFNGSFHFKPKYMIPPSKLCHPFPNKVIKGLFFHS